jgi:mannose-6-phosphate isomerase-like protein (cupin superfamily)
MNIVLSRQNARHYEWGSGCDGWHLHEGEDLSVIEERVPPGAAETRHRHRRARQFFYVLSGEARLELEGREHRLGPGEGLHVAPGAAHQLCNQGPAELRFLVISAPPSHGDREVAAA